MKKCSKCGSELPESFFSPNKSSSDGLQSNCRLCHAIQQRDYRKRNPEKIKALRKVESPEKRREDAKRYRKRHPDKKRSQNVITHGIEDGTITRPQQCVVCGINDNKLHGHHDDYAKPLEVRWVCGACHTDIHKNQLRAAGGAE